MLSLNDQSKPPIETLALDSNVEMSWKTFSGEFSPIIQALILNRINNEATNETEVGKIFLLHLHRGIAYLAGKEISEIDELYTITLNGISIAQHPLQKNQFADS